MRSKAGPVESPPRIGPNAAAAIGPERVRRRAARDERQVRSQDRRTCTFPTPQRRCAASLRTTVVRPSQ